MIEPANECKRNSFDYVRMMTGCKHEATDGQTSRQTDRQTQVLFEVKMKKKKQKKNKNRIQISTGKKVARF